MSSLPICQDCVSGTLHSGTAVGHIETIHGLQAYVSDPPNGRAPEGIIVMIAEVFGWEMPNIRLLSDSYARRTNCRVIIPDFMNGHWMDHNLLGMITTVNTVDHQSSILSTLAKIPLLLRITIPYIPFAIYNRASVVEPRLRAFFRAVRQEHGSLRVGVAGFCWGGMHAMHLCGPGWTWTTAQGEEEALVDAAFTAHPSLIKVPVDVEAVRRPLSVAVGDVDAMVSLEMSSQAQRVLEAKEFACEWRVVPGGVHGFAVRGGEDGEDERIRLEAEDQAVRWFQKHLLGK